MPHMLHDISNFAMDLALRAGELIVKERHDATFEQRYKSGEELVTSADLKVDELIRQRISKNFPDHQILSEESSPDLTLEHLKGPLWVIDPIDGTVNFAYGHNQVAVSIAYCEDGKAMLGIVHAPFLHETFHAIRGENALLNHKPVCVAPKDNLHHSLIATGFPYRKDDTGVLAKRVAAVLGSCRDIRRIGSAALDICWVACGRLDGYYETVSPWDLAAAKLIAREAGATVTYLGEVPTGVSEDLYCQDVVVATPGISEALTCLLRDASVST
jgi:myo-inositol-1(or 4)-monophosphatase